MKALKKTLSSRFALVALIGVFTVSGFTSCQRDGCPGAITKTAPVEVEQGC